MTKSFTEDYDDDAGVSTSNLKSVSQKKSIFDNSKLMFKTFMIKMLVIKKELYN
jgi:hypothetical protein